MTAAILSRRAWLRAAGRLVCAAVLTVGSAAHAALAADDAARQALAPGGKLKVGVYLGSPTSMLRDAKSGEAKGLAHDLGKELASRLGVPVEIVEYPRVAAVVDALKVGQVDFTVTNASPARVEIVNFSPPILSLELGYLVPAGSKLTGAAELDRPGLRFGVTQGSSSQGKLASDFKHAVMVTAPSVPAAIAMLAKGEVDFYATNKAILSEMSDELPGSKILPGRWGLEHMAIGVPKGREAGMAYLNGFAQDVKASGLVQRLAKRAGLRGMATDE
jgi:polar amino acid transport system substrate-binding protein